MDFFHVETRFIASSLYHKCFHKRRDESRLYFIDLQSTATIFLISRMRCMTVLSAFATCRL